MVWQQPVLQHLKYIIATLVFIFTYTRVFFSFFRRFFSGWRKLRERGGPYCMMARNLLSSASVVRRELMSPIAMLFRPGATL